MKNLIILLALGIAITLAGCSKEEPSAPQKTGVQPASKTTPITKTAVSEAKQVAKKTSEKVEQVTQQVKEKVVATVGQVKTSLISGQMVYTKACLSCHKFGISGAPKIGDKNAWASRLDDGKDELVMNAIKGIGMMPAKGGNSNLTDEEVKAAVDYMLEQSR